MWSVLLSVTPWGIIGALLATAIFIEPKPVGETVLPPIISSADRFYGITIVENPGFIWLAGNYGKIIRSTNHGTSWIQQDSGTRKHLQDIAAWDANHAVAVGNDGVVLRTENGGDKWTQISVPRSEVSNKFLRAKTFSKGQAMVVGEMGAIIKTVDYGRTWKRVVNEQDISWNDVAFNGSDYWVVGEFGRMVLSRDSDSSWSEIQSPVKSSLIGVAFRDPSHGVAVGLDGVILVTNDGGRNWKLSKKVTTEHLYAVTATDAGWIVVGDKGRVLLSDKEGMKWAEHRLGERNLSWHTSVMYSAGQAYITGSTTGIWKDDRWTQF